MTRKRFKCIFYNYGKMCNVPALIFRLTIFLIQCWKRIYLIKSSIRGLFCLVDFKTNKQNLIFNSSPLWSECQHYVFHVRWKLESKEKMNFFKITNNFPECIERYVEDQAYFLRSSDSSPRPSSPPLLSANCLSFSVFLCVVPVELTDERGVGGGRGAKLYDSENAWFSINHLKLSKNLIVQMHHPVPCTLYYIVQILHDFTFEYLNFPLFQLILRVYIYYSIHIYTGSSSTLPFTGAKKQTPTSVRTKKYRKE